MLIYQPFIYTITVAIQDITTFILDHLTNIINWNKEAETLEFKQCVKFNLRCGFGKLINKLKSKSVFTDEYLDTFVYK